jgi:hypothetical protein
MSAFNANTTGLIRQTGFLRIAIAPCTNDESDVTGETTYIPCPTFPI